MSMLRLAIVFLVAIYPLVAARPITQDISRVFFNVGLKPRASTPGVPSKGGNKVSEHENSEKAQWEKKWFEQLEQSWIQYDPKKPWYKQCEGYGKMKEAFDDVDLTARLVHRQPIAHISDVGSNNKGLFTLPNWPKLGKPVVVKLLSSDLAAACEVFALRRFRIFVETGFTFEQGKKFYVIVMKRELGSPFVDIQALEYAPIQQQRKIVQDVKERVFEKSYENIVEYESAHADMTSSNVLLEIEEDTEKQLITLKDVHLVDYGHPSIWKIRGGPPSKEIYKKWFNSRWNFLWKPVNTRLNIEDGDSSSLNLKDEENTEI